MRQRALIIGGGIGGLAAAISLRLGGIEAHVYERALELKEVGAGLSLWSNGSKALDLLGLRDPWRSITTPLMRADTRLPSGRVLGWLNVGKLNATSAHPSVAAHRGELLDLLHQAIPLATVHVGKELHHFADNGDGVTAAFTDGSEVQGAFLVGADGISSLARRQLFPSAVAAYAGYSTWRGVARMDPGPGWPKRALVRTVGRGEYFGVGEISRNRYLWYATKNMAEEAAEPEGRKGTLLRHFGQWHHPIPELLATTHESDMLLHPVYKMPVMQRWSKGRITLLGDAAHPIEPSLGMGAALALEDAVVLARCLKEHDDVRSALIRYQELRRPRVKKIVRASAFLAKTEQLRSPVACRLRDLSSMITPEPILRAATRPLMTFEPGG